MGFEYAQWDFWGLTQSDWVKDNLGLEGTPDIHGNSKTRRGFHFMIEHLCNKNASNQSGSNTINDLCSTRSEYLRFC